MKEQLWNGINDTYDIGDFRYYEIVGGRADLYKIETKYGDFVFKYFREETTVEDVLKEIKVCEFLRSRKINTSEFLMNKSGEYYEEIGGRLCTMQKFIQGKVYDNNCSPSWFLESLGYLLGRLWNELSYFNGSGKIKTRWGKGWPDKNEYQDFIMTLNNLLNELPENNIILSDKIKFDIDFKFRVIDKLLEDPPVDTRLLTYAITHGDYSTRQIIVNEADLSIIDFETLCIMPLIWEVVRSYSYASPICENAEIDYDEFKEYLKKANSYKILSEYDYSHAVAFYALQLGLNAFGFLGNIKNGYILDKSLLEFGFWRTRLLRNLMNMLYGKHWDK